MQALWPWFVIAQAAALPALAPGTEVRIVSPDLLTVYAAGTVEGGRLRLVGDPLPIGRDARILLFPPDAGPDAVAAAASGAAALAARVDADGVRLLPPDGTAPVRLRDALAAQGIVLTLPGEAPGGAP